MTNFRREAVVYALALAFLALMSIGSFLIIDSIVSRQQHLATVLNISSRQQMLSQRIALLSEQLTGTKTAEAREAIADQLRGNIDLMRRSHRDLVDGSLALGIDPPKKKELKDIYFSPPNDLNRRVPDFLASADQVVEAVASGASSQTTYAAAQVVSLANQTLLEALEAAVNQYAAESEAIFRQSQIRVLFVTTAMLIALATEAMFIFMPLLRRMRDLVSLAQSDPLTGCYNRRSFLEAATRDFARSRRTGSPLSVIFFDIDHFKQINDTYGHGVGDEVIRALTETVKAAIRTTDMLGRLGGEEFIVLLPDTDVVSAFLVAEKLRGTLASAVVKHEDIQLHFTASFGVTQISDQDGDPLVLIERADACMYEAKRAGRNCVKSEKVTLEHLI